MKYRIIKKDCWWTSVFTTGTPQFLYYDFDMEHFEVGTYRLASRYKWEFSKEDLDIMKRDYNLDDEFFIDRVREKGDNL